MLASELIKTIQKRIDEVGDNYIYVCSPITKDFVKGFDILEVGIDANESIVIDTK